MKVYLKKYIGSDKHLVDITEDMGAILFVSDDNKQKIEVEIAKKTDHRKEGVKIRCVDGVLSIFPKASNLVVVEENLYLPEME